MNNTKSVESLPSVSLTSQEIKLLGRSPGTGLAVMDTAVLLMKILMPYAGLHLSERSNFSRADLIKYSTAPTYWGVVNGKAGDVLIISGSAKDTSQKFTYYFLMESKKVSSTGIDWNGRCILMLMEGEPPLWGNISSL